MKKEIIIGALLLIIGFVIGILCRPNHFRDATDMVKDTLVIYDTARYSKLELANKSYRLNVPKIEIPSLVYIPADSTTIIYRDSIRYVTLPREYFYTKVEDAEIWHSGIDSRIDSLNIFRENVKITTEISRKNVKNTLGIGIEASYLNTPTASIYLEYERLLHKNASFYANVFYDIPSQMKGISAGFRLHIGW